MLQETVRVAFLSDSNAQLFCFGLDGFDGVFKRYQRGAIRNGLGEVLVRVDD